MLLAGVGLYAAFAHAVVLRKREIAIRIALGATPSAIRALISAAQPSSRVRRRRPAASAR